MLIGSEVEILKGAGLWLRQRVVCVTAEMQAFGYDGGHAAHELQEYMLTQEFVVWDQTGGDYLFVNTELMVWLPHSDCYSQGL